MTISVCTLITLSLTFILRQKLLRFFISLSIFKNDIEIYDMPHDNVADSSSEI